MDNLLSQLPGYALRRAANTAMTRFTAMLAPLDVKITEAAIFMLIRESANLTSSKIGKELEIQRANMVPMLQRMEDAGWIQREAIDGKSQAIVLTAEGRTKAEEVAQTVEQFEAELLHRVPAQHRKHLLPALNAIWN
ncbi:MarR family winged helix-turn-helix transcriptional regulator [Novosphingobium album (ex Hu et al. 2023)]|uniref:MarR family transcriptional regulator n=1 Tax=Novosphingobium album (ex Hu et al. 2023) TaxID=2930093 RepID=A0ABT0B7H7_9SPHN|nr:MarR family transcriptional regulator [Novosphingobium album (ex Hu et al. 2023)]MCJ2180977.1 MarR family transcriptional regulator [Novosphingobium album (ex Hu et al. 2023)]